MESVRVLMELQLALMVKVAAVKTALNVSLCEMVPSNNVGRVKMASFPRETHVFATASLQMEYVFHVTMDMKDNYIITA